jgi:two-component system sensor histidine kinase AlgZ
VHGTPLVGIGVLWGLMNLLRSKSVSEVTRSSQHAAVQGDFLPNLCTLEAVFRLVILGELLALALVLADLGVKEFDLAVFGMLSLMVQWVVLVSAAGLCQLAPWFRKLKPWQSTLLAYVWILAASTLIGFVALYIQVESLNLLWPSLATQMLITMVIAGVALRYFYVQQQLQEQIKAELRARIQALQSRIRPHFLFNSMNSIASLIAIDPERAEAMRALASTEEDQGFLLRIKTEPFSCSFLRTGEYFLPDRIPCESRLS